MKALGNKTMENSLGNLPTRSNSSDPVEASLSSKEERHAREEKLGSRLKIAEESRLLDSARHRAQAELPEPRQKFRRRGPTVTSEEGESSHPRRNHRRSPLPKPAAIERRGWRIDRDRSRGARERGFSLFLHSASLVYRGLPRLRRSRLA
ncbi:hypothetical protein KM043_005896 [Ampulex compressa]|nr:hypothetical protein KM043_005896 [Ampulex compressa]